MVAVNSHLQSSSAANSTFDELCIKPINHPIKIALKVYRAHKSIEQDWRKLERVSGCSPFQRLSWLVPLYEYITQERDIHSASLKSGFIIAGYEEDTLVLVAPMMIEETIFCNRLKWVGSEISDYNGFVMDPKLQDFMTEELFNQIIGNITSALPDIDAVHLTRNPTKNLIFNCAGGDTATSWQGVHSSHILNLEKNWKKRYSELRSKKSRSRLRSKFRALKKEHRVTFKQVRNAEEQRTATEQILGWKTQQLLRRGARNPFGNAAFPSAIRTAINSSVKSNTKTSLKTFGLYLDGDLKAGMLAFIANGKFYYLVSAYSSNIPDRYSIGTQLLLKTMEFASRSNLEQYDFLLGDEAYKFDWCDTTVPLIDRIIPLNIKGKIYAIVVRSSQRVKKQILRSKRLQKLASLYFKITSEDKTQTTDRQIGCDPGLSDLTQETENPISASQLLTKSYPQNERF